MQAKILIVDDSATIRHQLRSCLMSAGYTVQEADNGATGLECAKNQDFDLMIVDVNMPVMNGLEMLKALREIEACKDTPAFVLTTESSREMVALGKQCGALAWIVKPFKPKVLLKGVAHVLATREKAA